MNKTVFQYLKESKDVLNYMKPFANMQPYGTISVTYKIRNLKADIITYPWKACGIFDFYDYSLDDLQFKGVLIKDCEFISCEIVDKGLVIECKAK